MDLDDTNFQFGSFVEIGNCQNLTLAGWFLQILGAQDFNLSKDIFMLIYLGKSIVGTLLFSIH